MNRLTLFYNPSDLLIKIVIVGDSGVGKTCLLNRYYDGSFTESNLMTIGVQFYKKEIEIENKSVTIQIWDTV
jgi:small GTP-binding protein